MAERKVASNAQGDSYRNRVCQNVPSIARVAAGDFGFLILIQVFDGARAVGHSASLRRCSKSKLAIALNISPPSPPLKSTSKPIFVVATRPITEQDTGIAGQGSALQAPAAERPVALPPANGSVSRAAAAPAVRLFATDRLHHAGYLPALRSRCASRATVTTP